MTEDSVSTQEPQAEATIEKSRLRRKRWWAIGFGGALGAVLVAALFLIQLPYFVIQPGTVKPAEQRIEIEGARSYETPGRVMFVTVFINRANPALLIRSRFDKSYEVRSQEEMYPEGNEEEVQQENVILMDTSKLVAEKVALDYLGLPAEFSGRGALVSGLVESSPSKGILVPGDVVVEVDKEPVQMPDDIGKALKSHEPGQSVELVVERPVKHGAGESASGKPKRKKKKVEVALGADPDHPSRPVLGVFVEPYDLSVDSPVDVKVDSGSVTGPSAGLAWTLAIIDRLTPGSLTDGRKVAVTGEIRGDGTVGQVGGTPQKVAAVKRAGVKVFLYPESTPESEQSEIRRIAGKTMKVYPVGTIEDAVKVLAPQGVRRP